MSSQWKVIGAAVIGSGHLRANLPIQDRYGVHANEELVVIAVADGAGSAPHSAEGAACAVESAVASIRSVVSLDSTVSRDLIQAALYGMIEQTRTNLEQLAHSKFQCAVGHLATTLLAVVVTKEWLATVQIGDGGIVLQTSAGQLELLPVPQKTEYVNETTFLTSSNYREQAIYTVHHIGDVAAFAVFTDGVEFLSVRKGIAHEAYFLPLFEWASSGSPEVREAELREYLASPRVCDRTDDDKTLVVVVHDETR